MENDPKQYTPYLRGDIVYYTAGGEVGSEQHGGRPGIIVSNDDANMSGPDVTIVPLTTRPKTGLPTHVRIRSAQQVSTALCESIRTISKERLQLPTGNIYTCTKDEMEEVNNALMIHLGIEHIGTKVQVEQPAQMPPQSEDWTKEAEALVNARVGEVAQERDFYRREYYRIIDKLLDNN